MKKALKNILIKLLNPIIKKLGYIKKTAVDKKSNNNFNDKNTLLLNFYSILNVIGFAPRHIVDVGANHGTWTREALNFFPHATYSLFEPQYWMKDSIKDILDSNEKVYFNPVGVGKTKGSFKFTIVDRDDSCSFKYTEEEAGNMGFQQIEVPMVTLNEFLVENKLPVPDIIKIDAEGLDMEVLEGASHYFGKTEVFMIEAAVVCDTIDNTILKVMNFMNEKGYTLFDITDMNRPFVPKVLWLMELVFVLKGGMIDNWKMKK